MISKKLSIVLLTIAICGTAFAQRLPEYYPDRFQRTGTVDDVQGVTIVINDIPYTLSSSIVVHSLSESQTSLARVRPGELIGYLLGENRQIAEIWLLPRDYDESRNRR